MIRQSAFDGDGGQFEGSIVVRGVVINTYFADEEERPGILGEARGLASGPKEVKAIACDVLTYGSRFRFFFQQIPVAQMRHGLNDYDLWVPRPTTVDLSTGQAPILPAVIQGSTADNTSAVTGVADQEQVGDPRNFDGDHVLVELLEMDPQQAFIRADQLPHPRANFRMVRQDGDRSRSRFRGVSRDIDGSGNATLDTTNANGGQVDGFTGEETPALDANHGNVTVRMNYNAELNVIGVKNEAGDEEKYRIRLKDGELLVRLSDGESALIQGNGAATDATLGSGGENVVNFSHLETLWNAFMVALDAHTHATGMGPSSPPIPLFSPTFSPMSSVAPNIKSTKLKIPPTP